MLRMIIFLLPNALLCVYPDVDAIFLMLTTLIWEYKNGQITSISNSFRSLIDLTTKIYCKGVDFISVYHTSMCENYIFEIYLVNFETKNVLDLVLHTGFKQWIKY